MEEHVYEALYRLEDEHWWFRGRRAVIRALLGRARLQPRPAILDAGCGTGRTLVELATLGTAVGLDASPSAVRFCHERGLSDVQLGTLEALPFAAGSFDLLLACDVLEHLDDDRGALRELQRVASPLGRLLITVPAYRLLWSQHDDAHHHRRRYTLQQLRRAALDTGWRVQQATYFNTLLLPPIALVRMLRRSAPREGGRSDYELTPRQLNRWLSRTLEAEAELIGRGVRLPAGLSVAMVCQLA